MKTEKLEFDVTSAYGNELPNKVHVGPLQVELFTSREEIPDGKRLNDDQYVAAVNARIKASIRAKATADALDAAGIKRPDANDPDVIRENMVKMIMKLHGVNEDVARRIQQATEDAAKAVTA